MRRRFSRPLLFDAAEFIATPLARLARPKARRQRAIRPVFCPDCRRHYTTVKPARARWPAQVKHVTCAECVAEAVLRGITFRADGA